MKENKNTNKDEHIIDRWSFFFYINFDKTENNVGFDIYIYIYVNTDIFSLNICKYSKIKSF